MSTRTINPTLQNVLDDANPNQVADVLQQVKLGSVLTLQKQTFTSLSSAAAIDITTAASAAAASPGVNTNQEPPASTLPPIGQFVAGRITAGTAHTIPFIVTDAAGTPTDPASGIAVATLSADGKTLTFGAAVTGFVLWYYPAPAASMQAAFGE